MVLNAAAREALSQPPAGGDQGGEVWVPGGRSAGGAWGARWWSVVVDEDVIVEDEPPQREEDLATPARVVGRRRIQHHGHEGLDVVKTSGLSVESGDEVGVEVGGGGVRWGLRIGESRTAEEALRGGHLGGQSGVQGTLTLQGEGGSVRALPRGRHSGLDRGEGADERGVGGGRDSVTPGWWSEGGKTRWGAATQGQRGGGGDQPKAGDVGGAPWVSSLLGAAGAMGGWLPGTVMSPTWSPAEGAVGASIGRERSRGTGVGRGVAAPGEDGGAEQSAWSEQRGGGDGAWAARLPGGGRRGSLAAQRGGGDSAWAARHRGGGDGAWAARLPGGVEGGVATSGGRAD
eukprot:XP_020401131.1 uncharacterized protein LOC109942954 [Zea mays]